MFVLNEYIQNFRGYGEAGEVMMGSRWEPGLLRPFWDTRREIPGLSRKGQIVENKRFFMKPCVEIKTGEYTYNEKGQKVPVYEQLTIDHARKLGMDSPVLTQNATALTKDAWIEMDKAVLKVQRERLVVWDDLQRAGTYQIDPWKKKLLEHHTMSDTGEVIVDMEGTAEPRQTQQLFNLEAVPLPFTYAGWEFSRRDLEISQQTGEAHDTVNSEIATRRVIEQIEKTAIGSVDGLTYGVVADYGRTPSVYGLTNFSARNTKTDMTAPTGSNGTTVLTEWLEVRQLLYDDNFRGPYVVYVSSDYDQYLDNLFSTTEPSAGSLRDALLRSLKDVTRIVTSDYLPTPFNMVMVQMTSDVVQAVVGMQPTVMQWTTQGGMKHIFRVMACMATRLRADYTGQCGIAHATTA